MMQVPEGSFIGCQSRTSRALVFKLDAADACVFKLIDPSSGAGAEGSAAYLLAEMIFRVQGATRTCRPIKATKCRTSCNRRADEWRPGNDRAGNGRHSH